MKTPIKLSDHFTYGKLIRFVFPSIVMMIFTSVYTVVDGLFVSNFVGKTPFVAINLIYPLIMILGAIGFMLGTGGTAIVAKTLGQGERELANRYFSMLVYVAVGAGIVLAAVGIPLLRPVSRMLGAKGEVLEYCILYGTIILAAMPCYMLQFLFQSFFVTAEKPKLGLVITVAAGLTNIVLDALFVAGFRWGLAGAAIATAMSQVVGGVTPVVYFARKNSSLLRLGKTRFYGKVLLRTCTNGASELLSNISASVVTVLYNFQLLHLAGEDGVAAYGVIMYVAFFFAAVFIGYSVGSAPLVSYQFGAENHVELRNLYRKSLVFVGVSGIAMALLSFLLSGPLSKLFVGYDAELYTLTVRGFRFYAVSFLLSGFNIFGSSFFTALNNGAISGTISFLRALVFQCLCILALPAVFGVDGIWSAVIAAELMSLLVTGGFLVRGRNRYHYA